MTTGHQEAQTAFDDGLQIRVSLGDRSYDVHVGENLLEKSGGVIAERLNRPWTVIVTDENVAAAQGPRFRKALNNAGIETAEIILPPGEGTKSFSSLEILLNELLALGVERQDLIIAFGGGVIGDLVGFAAGILRRGCRFAQIPTSLLAQVDSSVGGKTAINSAYGKNLVGLFHQPDIVIADVGVLETLPDRHRRAGYAEIVKYAAIGDAQFFDWLEENGEAAVNGATDKIVHAVAKSVEAKAAIVADDEREAGRRALLNFGHTFGHALEASFQYSDRLLHGEAVAAGMGLAFDYSVQNGTCPKTDADRFKEHLRACGLPAGLSDIDGAAALAPGALLTLMRQDKKVSAGEVTLILADAIGAARIETGVDQNKLLDFLTAQFPDASH